MPVKITLGTSSRTTSPGTKLLGDKLVMSRTIYQRLGSIVHNRTLSEDVDSGILPGDFVRTMEQLGDLHNFKYYGTVSDIPASIEELDKYLGSLGVTEEYKYSKDVNSLAPWLSTTSQTDYRVLVDEDGNVLTDGDDILVYYT